MSKELIKKTAEYVKRKLYDNPSGHDWYHIERVWKLARHLQAAEGGDLEVIELAVFLHNLGEHSDARFQPEKSSLVLYGMMDVLEIEEPLKSKILKIIDEMKFGGRETKSPATLEGKIVQDANFLDSLGAIGVARQLASGGYHGRPIYDPEVKVRTRLSHHEYQFQKKKGTSINNLYEKALQMAGMLNTATARKIAECKVKFVEKFLEQFEKEWDEFENM